MFRSVMLAASMALAITALDAGPATAKPCRNAAGKFIKCPAPPAPVKRCKDAKGKFVKCSAPGAIPVITQPKPPVTTPPPSPAP